MTKFLFIIIIISILIFFFKNHSTKIITFFKRLLSNPMIRALAFRGLWRVLRLLIFRR